MDPTSALVMSAPPEWIPVLILAALVLKGFTAWLDRKKTAQLLDATPSHEEPTSPAIHQDPNVKG